MFFENEKPALLQQIDAELEKVSSCMSASDKRMSINRPFINGRDCTSGGKSCGNVTGSTHVLLLLHL